MQRLLLGERCLSPLRLQRLKTTLNTSLPRSLQKMKKIIPLSAGILLWQLRDNMAFCQVSLPVDLEDEGGGGGGGIARGLAASLIEKEKKKSQTLWERLMEKLRWLFQLFSRCVHLLFNYSPALISSPALLLPSASLREHWWTLLVSCIRSGGPCGVKFAQWLSTRPDLFPADLCRRLQALQSYECSRPLSLEAVRAVLSENLGSNWSEELSVDVDSEGRPIVLGEGAVAQVLRGELRLSLSPTAASKRAVAIKLIRPEVEESIKADLSILMSITGFLERVFAGLDNISLSDSVEEFRIIMLQQLDMREEADHLQRFRLNFFNENSWVPGSISYQDSSSSSTTPLREPSISFPEPVPGLVRRQVLVEGLENGVLLRDFAHICSEEEKRAVAKLGMEAIFQMVFEDSFIHADLHPGNIVCYGPSVHRGSSLGNFDVLSGGEQEEEGDGLPTATADENVWRKALNRVKEIWKIGKVVTSSAVKTVGGAGGRRGEVDESGLRLCFIDAGLTVQLTSDDQLNLIELFRAVVTNDGETVAQLLIDRSRAPHHVQDATGFLSGVKRLVGLVNESGLSLGRIGISAILNDLLLLCFKHQVKIEPRYSTVIVAMGVVEGIGRQLDPDIDILQQAAPYILRASVKRMVK